MKRNPENPGSTPSIGECAAAHTNTPISTIAKQRFQPGCRQRFLGIDSAQQAGWFVDNREVTHISDYFWVSDPIGPSPGEPRQPKV
jgi:hypothetical protein